MSKSLTKILKWSLALLLVLVGFFIIRGYQKSDVPVTYLPDTRHSGVCKIGNKQKRLKLQNDWYKLSIDTAGNIMINSAENKSIISCLSYHADYEGSGGHTLTKASVLQETDSTAIIEGFIDRRSKVRIIITVPGDYPKVNFTVKTSYYDSTAVIREALIAHLDIRFKEVYQRNRQVDTDPFHSEYWIGNEGFKSGEGSRSLMIYHPDNISSMQLDTKKDIVLINLDSQLDHPFFQIPFQKDGGGKWNNRSEAFYKAGDERTNEFTMYIGAVPKYVPRLMLVPNGYLAGYVFTEHADFANLKSHRAAYFGSETITDISKATGGFAEHDIPVTKSVFFEDFDGEDTGYSDSAKISELEYSNFLDQLYSTGLYDLCLHTPEEGNSNRAYLEEAIKAMKEKYDAVTWIDHGFFGGDRNREALVADGLDPSSEYYAADLWHNYGTKYFWSPAVEAIRFSKPEISIKKELLRMKFLTITTELWRRYNYSRNYLGESTIASTLMTLHGYFPRYELNSLQSFRSSALPTPLYWQNLTIAGTFYSWTTEYVYNGIFGKKPEKWLSVEKRGLNMLVSDWGVFLNHGYYVRNIAENKILADTNGKLVINPTFDEILSYMDFLRDKGDLLITTVKEIMNYWLLIENISFNYNTDGSVEIWNNNDEPINGLSLAIRARNDDITLDFEKPLSRVIGDETILWFDIQSREKRTLRVTN